MAGGLSSRERAGVVLLAFGGPESLDEIPEFLASIIGRIPPPHVEHEVIARYRRLGGRSPLPEMTRLERSLVRSELARRGLDWPVYLGMLHARPSIEQAAEEVVAEGTTRLAAISMTPFRARVSTGSYEARLRKALSEHQRGPQILLPNAWNLQAKYVTALAELLAAELEKIPSTQLPAGVVFSAHSLPLSHIEGGDPYATQLQATAAAVADRLGLDGWSLAYQSVSSVAREPWLGPTVEEAIDDLKGTGRKSVVVHPIGFLTDHLETLYDNDIVHREHAERIGLGFHRPPCLNDHPLLIEALADIAQATLVD